MKSFFQKHRNAILGLTATVILFLFWVLLMDWIVMPVYTHRGQEMELPDVTEYPFEEAKKNLESKGFKVIMDQEKYDSMYPKGIVISQNPEPYTRVKKGRRVYLTVSAGEKPVLVPNLVGRSERDGTFLLQQMGLLVGKVEYQFDSYYPAGVICGQSIPPDQEVSARTPVDLLVSRGPMPSRFIVPKVVGKPLASAQKILWDAGLEAGPIQYETRSDLLPGTVIAQRIPPGTEVHQGTSVGLTVTRSE